MEIYISFWEWAVLFNEILLNSNVLCSIIKRGDYLKTTKFRNILLMICFGIVVNLKDRPTGIVYGRIFSYFNHGQKNRLVTLAKTL